MGNAIKIKTIWPDKVELANEFIKVLNEWLTAKQIEAINTTNKTPEYKNTGACASHEFCDPNQAMIDAWVNITGQELPLPKSKALSLVNEAWLIAKTKQFKIT